jgi:uncharacterized phiE125 gp8 family phage protein
MKTVLVTAPAESPVSLSEVKAHLNVSISDDDTLLGIYIDSAVARCEQVLQRKLITQTWRVYFDSWPTQIVFPFGNLQSVTSVKYTDEDETERTVDSDDYTVDTVSVPGRVVLKDDEIWPTYTLFNVNPIVAEFVTGYGDTGVAVPADIRNAVLLTVGHMYANRESYLVNDSNKAVVEEIPLTANALLNPYRMWGMIL